MNPSVTSRTFSEEALIREFFEREHEAGARPGVLIDVGAFFGGALKPYLAMGWDVHAFEPDPIKHDKLLALASRQPFRLWTCALGAEPKDGVPFFASNESQGIASMLPFRHSHEETCVVRVRTLADVLAEAGVKRVDYLKVDAEGYDLRVLQGLDWSSVRPRMVMAEFEDSKTTKLGYGTHDLGRFFLEHGYEVWMSEWHPIERYGVQHRWRSLRRYPAELEDAHAWGNFIAVRREDAGAFAHVAEPWS
ncbi:MAG: FkbM family methyltransferase [Planctomycetota bacterium]